MNELIVAIGMEASYQYYIMDNSISGKVKKATRRMWLRMLGCRC